jgi:hypothetical protein
LLHQAQTALSLVCDYSRSSELATTIEAYFVHVQKVSADSDSVGSMFPRSSLNHAVRAGRVEDVQSSSMYDEDRLARTQSDIPVTIATSSQCGRDVDRSLAAGSYSGEITMF